MAKTYRKLKPEQRKALQSWIEAGLSRKEIRFRAGSFNPPFKVTHQQLYYYRENKEPDVDQVLDEIQAKAFRAGLDLSVEKLRQGARAKPRRALKK